MSLDASTLCDRRSWVGSEVKHTLFSTADRDTTSYVLSEAMHPLTHEPSRFSRVKLDPDSIAPLVTEAAIRYASSVRYFSRAAANDTPPRRLIFRGRGKQREAFGHGARNDLIGGAS